MIQPYQVVGTQMFKDIFLPTHSAHSFSRIGSSPACGGGHIVDDQQELIPLPVHLPSGRRERKADLIRSGYGYGDKSAIHTHRDNKVMFTAFPLSFAKHRKKKQGGSLSKVLQLFSGPPQASAASDP